MQTPNRSDLPLSKLGNLNIIYDGDCPFCQRYVTILQLREAVGKVQLVNAREHPEVVEFFNEYDMPLNDGMVAEYENSFYYGKDAMNFLALVSSRSGVLNRCAALIMKNKILASVLYPIFVAIRKATLKVIGVPKLG
ncbi:MAG: DCC1-like thiol-disulfide oxidoreductase family protein [Pseudomonadota bacterium]